MCAELSQVCVVPRLSGVGGMVSFQGKLVSGLSARGVSVTYDLEAEESQAVLVVGGTRHWGGLRRARRRGVRVVQRLDGMNWLHRRRRTGLRHYLRAEYGNLSLAYIRARLADEVVYQSRFSKVWWERVRGAAPVPDRVVYNGVELEAFTPLGTGSPPHDRWRILMVEGSLMGGYEMGLDAAVRLAQGLARLIRAERQVELVVVGRVPEGLQRQTEEQASIPIRWEGVVEHRHIPEVDRSAHILYAADINAACPNSVIEALACGLPVVAFDTGALPEMVTAGAGQLVPYGGDPWKLEAPDYRALVEAAWQVIQNQESYREAARRRAEQAFGLDQMVQGYLQALGG